MSEAATVACLLCGHPTQAFHHRGVGSASPGDYRRCRHCGLSMLEADAWLDREEERTYYKTHENRPGDPGYLLHLERLITPLTQAIPAPATGLDWGCGPHPVLADRLRKKGYQMAAWDPAFGPALPAAPADGWDFITCTEVIEHLHEPRASLKAMLHRIRPGGVLAIMTEWLPEPRQFNRWHYRRDPTHVAFYSPNSLRWAAQHFGCTVDLPARGVALFTRSQCSDAEHP